MNIELFEGQSYLCQILIFIKSNEGAYVEEMLRGPFKKVSRPTIYRALRKLESLTLITDKLEQDRSKGIITRTWYLTPLGEQITEHVTEIDKLLGTRKPKRNSV